MSVNKEVEEEEEEAAAWECDHECEWRQTAPLESREGDEPKPLCETKYFYFSKHKLIHIMYSLKI